MYIITIQCKGPSAVLQPNLETPIWFGRKAYAAGNNEIGTWLEFKIRLKEIPRIMGKVSRVLNNCIWVSGLRKHLTSKV